MNKPKMNPMQIALSQQHILEKCLYNIHTRGVLTQTGPFYFNLINHQGTNKLIGFGPSTIYLSLNKNDPEETGPDFRSISCTNAKQILNSINIRNFVEYNAIAIHMDSNNVLEDIHINTIDYVLQRSFPLLNKMEILFDDGYDKDNVDYSDQFLKTFQKILETFPLQKITSMSLYLQNVMQAWPLIENAKPLEEYIRVNLTNMKEIKLLVPIRKFDFKSKNIEKMSFKIFKIEFKISLNNPNTETRKCDVEFVERFAKLLNDTICEKNQSKIKLTLLDYPQFNIHLFERICKLNYVNVQYFLKDYDFLKHTCEWTPRSSFSSLKALNVTIQYLEKYALKNQAEIVNNLSYLINLNSVQFDFKILQNVESIGAKRLNLLKKVIYALPASVHTLKLIYIPFYLDNEELNKTLPNLKYLTLTTAYWNAYGQYPQNYFMKFQQLQLLYLGCVQGNEFDFPPNLRVLFEFCISSCKESTRYTLVTYQSNPQLNEFGEKDFRESEKENSFSISEHNKFQDELFTKKKCNCGKLRSHFKNVHIKNWFRNSFQCISFANIKDWDLYLKTDTNFKNY